MGTLPNHRPARRPFLERRSHEDHSRPETNTCRPAHAFQGLRRRRRRKRTRRIGCQVQQRSCDGYKRGDNIGEVVGYPGEERL
ncbi:hypothetical protein Gogos_014162, partial [Gossypium gossypioides]|nr:hypothetical protein [Gossypium gossypioides]